MSPDGTKTAALFREDQTDELVDPGAGWTTIVAREARPRRERTNKPKVKVRREPNGTTSIWVGPNKELIKVLQEDGWKYNGKTKRWVAERADARNVAGVLEEHFNVKAVIE